MHKIKKKIISGADIATLRKIKKKISNGADLAAFMQGLMRSIGSQAMYHDDVMWADGSLVRLKVVADLYEKCDRQVSKIWERKWPEKCTVADVYISDDRCMLQITCGRELTIGTSGVFVIFLDYNFAKGYAVCDICEASGKNGIRYCYCVTLLGAMKLLTDWCYYQYAKSYKDNFLLKKSKVGRFLKKYVDYGKALDGDDNSVYIGHWAGYALDVEDVLSGGPVLCGGGVKRIDDQ